jgi:hypothetical protein
MRSALAGSGLTRRTRGAPRGIFFTPTKRIFRPISPPTPIFAIKLVKWIKQMIFFSVGTTYLPSPNRTNALYPNFPGTS